MQAGISRKIIPFPDPCSSEAEPTKKPEPMSTVSQSTGTEQVALSEHPEFHTLDQRISALEQRPVATADLSVVRIYLLPSKVLTAPLDVIVEPDGGSFIARTADIPLYGFGADSTEAIDMLKREIESLYEDLMEDDDFSEKWLRIKQFLSSVIIDR